MADAGPERPKQAHVRVGVGVLVKDPNRPASVFSGVRKGSHGAGTLSLPGGHLEMFESWQDTAIREVKEEMDLDLDPASCKFCYVTNDIMHEEDKHYVTIFIMAVCRNNDANPKNMEPHKCEGWKSYTWQELKNIYAKGEPKLFGPLQKCLQNKPEAVLNFMASQFDKPNQKKLQECREIIQRLRREAFNNITEKKMESHPYIRAAEANALTLAQKKAFVCEQYAIQKSDAISFAYLAGHRGFLPKSLSSATIPSEPAVNYPKQEKLEDLFQFLLKGELFAAPLLLDYASFLGMEGEETIQQESAGKLSPLAQAYPSYWSRLALNSERASAAAACAVNFPAWGRMCQRLIVALDKSYSGGECTKKELNKGLAFIQFFATPIDDLDEMAAATMAQEENICYEEIVLHVRLLQEYELLFWDACYDTD